MILHQVTFYKWWSHPRCCTTESSVQDSASVLLLPPRPVLDCLGEVRGLDAVAAGEIGNRPRELEDPMVSPRAQVELAHGRGEKLLVAALVRTIFVQLDR